MSVSVSCHHGAKKLRLNIVNTWHHRNFKDSADYNTNWKHARGERGWWQYSRKTDICTGGNCVFHNFLKNKRGQLGPLLGCPSQCLETRTFHWCQCHDGKLRHVHVCRNGFIGSCRTRTTTYDTAVVEETLEHIVSRSVSRVINHNSVIVSA